MDRLNKKKKKKKKKGKTVYLPDIKKGLFS